MIKEHGTKPLASWNTCRAGVRHRDFKSLLNTLKELKKILDKE